jgi:O-antigen/teichoic acid export membrane protein
MTGWFGDGVFRTVLRNAGYLATGRVAGALAGIVALSCVGRGLGPTLFGVLTLVHAYALGVSALVKFQTWQLVIRYGAPALERGDRRTATDAISLAFGLDVISGLVGMVLAMALLPVLAPHFGITREWLPLAVGYCTVIPTMASATPVGVMRLLGRFDLTAWNQPVTPFLRAIGAAISFALGLGFPAYVASWYVADIAGDLIGWGITVHLLRRADLRGGLRIGLFGTARRLPGAWGFTWTTNVAVSLGASWNAISNLVVGGILGPVAAGLYRIASTLLDSAGKPADLLTKGFYPEIMRLDPASKRPWRLALRTGLIAGGLGVAVIVVLQLGSRPLIGAIFGHKYLAAYDLLRLMMLALAVSMASFPLESLLYMAHRQTTALVVQCVATATYLALLAILSQRYGLTGSGIAYVLGNLTLACGMIVPVIAAYRTRARLRVAVPDPEPAPPPAG